MARPRSDNVQLKLRAPESLRDGLEKAAAMRGVSLNKEAVARLERSLRQPDVAEEVRRPAYGLMKLVEAAMEAAGESAMFALTHSMEAARNQSWLDSPHAYEQAMMAAVRVLGALRPPGKVKPPDPKTPWDGKFWADFVLKQAASGEPHVDSPEARQNAEDLHASLGTLAERITSKGAAQ